jgi:hypothetical protein
MYNVVIMPRSSRSRAGRWRLWSWLRDLAHAIEASMGATTDAVVSSHSVETEAGEAAVALHGNDAGARGAAVLPFPIRGEALLMKLTRVLEDRFAPEGPQRDPLLLAISPGTRTRLMIDRKAYVEFDQQEQLFHVTVEAIPETRVSLQTADFDIVVSVVLHYIGERGKYEAAS